ncbi:MAG TPA: UPF0280 family protein [Alphaproteobacteria bacterium]|nr:UPF0280 family protein [Alphaproteobacteria bacterium]
MAPGPQVRLLADGRRLHLQHGPIDLIVEGFGAGAEVAGAYGQAAARFATILDELVAELADLRRPFGGRRPGRYRSATARRMARAVAPHADRFITPMAAVAGAVADEVLAALLAGRTLERAYVNNGGDIALHLGAGEHFTTGLVVPAERTTPLGTIRIDAAGAVRGIATSGRGGRSFSLGIADSVTVLARDAAAADAAATVIGNAVDVDHPAIERKPARDLDPDSDLGDRPVTVSVGELDAASVAAALDAGEAIARTMRDRRLIVGAALVLAGDVRLVGGDISLSRSGPALATTA